MRIVVDAMGTDNRPVPDVEGAVLAAREYGDTIIFVGDKPRIEQALRQHNTAGLNIEIIHTEEEIKMDDKPSVVMKSKPNSSMHTGLRMIKDGQADGFVTMGNTGAAHAIATLSTLRRISGIKRPALTAIYPVHNREIIFLDIGANADSRAEWLEQFAIMGSIYAEKVFGRDKPRVGTMSNGEEEGKGNDLIREAQDRMRQLPINYVGHIEPKEILQGKADVVVTDGFVGNIFIKTFEGAVSYLTGVIREEMRGDIFSSIGGLLSRPAFGRVRKRIDPRDIGGAPLLGVDGVVIIGHGSSDAIGMKGAINQARLAIQADAINEIKQGLTSIGAN